VKTVKRIFNIILFLGIGILLVLAPNINPISRLVLRTGHSFIIVVAWMVLSFIISKHREKKNPKSIEDIFQNEEAIFILTPQILHIKGNLLIMKKDELYYFGMLMISLLTISVTWYVFLPYIIESSESLSGASSVAYYIMPILISLLASIFIFVAIYITKQNKLIIFQKGSDYFVFSIKHSESEDIFNLNEKVAKIPIENLKMSAIEKLKYVYWTVPIENATGDLALLNKYARMETLTLGLYNDEQKIKNLKKNLLSFIES